MSGGSRSTSIKIGGNVTEALAALDKLGIKAEVVGKQTEHALGGAAQRTGGVFSKLGNSMASWGLPFSNSVTKIGEKLGETETKGKSFGGALAEVGKVATVGLGAGMAVIGSQALKMGMSFEAATTQLVTGAGESDANLKKVRDGLLQMAPAVGMGPVALAKAMFLVESAGFHGADGLNVMKAAAEGAKIGGADATVVANGLTTAMTDYSIPANQAAAVTSKLIATVAAGKTNMQDLSGALSAVLPAASAAGIGLNQVLGAMGTMTGEGISAQQASQDLANTIRSLQNPTQGQAAAMDRLGFKASDVAAHLGKMGLLGTLNELSETIASKMGPSGVMLESTLKSSTQEADKAKTMLSAMSPALRSVAEGYLKGTITSKQWRADTKGMTVDQKQLAQEFAATVNRSRGFSDLLAKGGPAAKTFSAMLAEVTGGATGMNTTLALTGTHLDTFAGNVRSISGATTEAGGHVKGFAETQKDLQTKLDNAKAGVEALGTKLGMALIPKVTEAISIISGLVTWLGKHKDIAYALAAVVGGILVAAIGAWTVSLFAAGGALAFLMSPITLIVGGIALLAFGIYELYKHWDTVWKAIKSILSAAWDFIKDHFVLIMTVALGPLGLAIAELAKHWQAIWNAIKSALSDAWNFIRTVFNAIVQVGLWYIRNEIRLLQTIWNGIWQGISLVVQTVWGGLKAVFNTIVNLGIHFVRDEINGFKTIWDDVWNGVQTVVEDVWGVLKPIFDAIQQGVSDTVGAVGKVAGLVGHGIGSVAHGLGLSGGGWTQGAPGQVSPDYVHGGEYVMSRDMLAGTAPIDPTVVAAVQKSNSNGSAPASAFSGSNSGVTIENLNVNTQTSATAAEIAREAAWALKPYVGG